MSITSSNEVQQQGDKAIEEDTMPEWLNRFIEKTFFDKCITHDDLQKNDMNRYCITCDASTCKFCITSGNHEGHELLTIYRHVYQDVVPLCEMESHIDCDKIQPYKCNKKWVISLTPLPHNGSGLLIEGNGACIICKRKLTDPDRFRFCSIACKYESIIGKHESRGHGGASTSHRMNAEVGVEQQVSRKRNRKGVSHRAPFF